MERVKNVFLLAVVSFSLTFTACQENAEISSLKKITRPTHEIPDDVLNPTGGHDFPYPSIIKKTFIPSLDWFAHTKCIAWRIEWPAYNDSVDPDWIPSFFKTSNGALNSLNYLLSIDPENKKTLSFSLYRDEKIDAANNIADLWPWPESVEAKSVYFGKINKPVQVIQNWVTGRPSQFENNWEYVDSYEAEIDYQAGDFFIYHLPDEDLYGGIRIVSMAPRVIEVYLAVPND
ncbi:MAG: hypothetical protein AAF223_24050 [Bacteroidota bacterium]